MTNTPETIQALSVDNVVFGIDQGSLNILLVRQKDPRHQGLWALPGGWVNRNENLRDAPKRILQSLTGVSNIFLEQLQTFGQVDRFPGERVITVAYYALVRSDVYPLIGGPDTLNLAWHSVDELPKLVYDHSEILHTGLEKLRQEIRYRPIGFELLPDRFTLGELKSVYEAVSQQALDTGNFRRKILSLGILVDCGEAQQGVAHRAAKYYRFDVSAYHAYLQAGFKGLMF